MRKLFINIAVFLLILAAGNAYSFAVTNDNAEKNIYNIAASTTAVKVYSKPLDILVNPSKYLNKPVKIEAKFDKFTTLGLDYPKAMRNSENYITFTVQRNDITDHNVPLSEMKLFLKREYAENFIELNTDDKILIDGTMFSSALGDAWIDVDKIQVVEKAKKAKLSKYD